MSLDPWYLENLVCPVDQTPLTFDGEALLAPSGRRYPVVDGLPVMLIEDRDQTIGIARASLDRANNRDGAADPRAPELYLESVGVSEDEKAQVAALYAAGKAGIDPVVLAVVAATSGYAYVHLVGDGSLKDYPIPEISLPKGHGESLLDIGCNWGRWCVAAARRGYRPVGIDPSLGSVMAARRISRKMGLDNRFVVGDGRYLPFKPGIFDRAYSYSVLQHFSKTDAAKTLAEVGRVLKPGGMAKIQMANRLGVRSLQHQAVRRFREPEGFEVRYWSVTDLKAAFRSAIGPTRASADCYFGLGWQWSDYAHMPAKLKLILLASEGLRKLSVGLPPMTNLADSVFLTATKPA